MSLLRKIIHLQREVDRLEREMVAAELAWRKAQATVFDWHEHHTGPRAVDEARERYDRSRRRFEKMRSKLWSMQVALSLAGPN